MTSDGPSSQNETLAADADDLEVENNSTVLLAEPPLVNGTDAATANATDLLDANLDDNNLALLNESSLDGQANNETLDATSASSLEVTNATEALPECEDTVEGSGMEGEGGNATTAACAPKVTTPSGEPECKDTDFGCCADGKTGASGPEGAGCPESDCALSEDGCCPDGVTAVIGSGENCPHLKQPKQSKCNMTRNGAGIPEAAQCLERSKFRMI